MNSESRLEKATQSIKKKDSIDSLTQLPNRIFFNEYLSQILEQVSKDEMVGIFVIDLNEFKYINNTFNHRFGDELIKAVAERLTSDIKNIDLVGRMGGDEFILLSTKVREKAHIKAIAKELLSLFQKPFTLGNRLEICVTASMGISIYNIDGEDADTLITNADIAMYRAKELGKHNYHFYYKDKNNYDLNVINDLVKAIYNEEFELYYQPKVDVKSMELIGMEALIRWNHPKRGIIFPDQFIPIAEKTGLIVKIDEWVMKKACIQNKLWQQEGCKSVPVSVNISAVDLNHSNFYERVKGILEETNLDPKNLEIEITESDVIHNIDYAIQVIGELKKLGVKITMDDFGTGYASITNIKKLYFDSLKIDKSFVIDLNSSNGTIISAIISMAKVLGVRVTAEGVEKREHIDFLRKINCDYAQGYLFSKPLSKNSFKKKWLATGLS